MTIIEHMIDFGQSLSVPSGSVNLVELSLQVVVRLFSIH